MLRLWQVPRSLSVRNGTLFPSLNETLKDEALAELLSVLLDHRVPKLLAC